MDEVIDLVIIGAGPAGMAAACQARELGLSVTLLDEQPAPGGQIYRQVDSASDRRVALLGEDYAAGRALTAALRTSGAVHLGGASVWNVEADGTVHYLRSGHAARLAGRRVLLASGAMERPFPIPGWTLPGVMGAGAAQILLKSAGALPAHPAVLAGCGPLLYLLAWQYLRAGVALRAVVDTTREGDYLRALRHIGSGLRGWRDLKKGLRLMAALRRARVPVYRGARDLAVDGADSAQGLRFTHGGVTRQIASPLILLHQGVVPNTQLTWALRAAHRWNPDQLCWQPQTDAWGRLGDSLFYAAGDSAGIVGAQASATQGRLAALAVAAGLARLDAAALARRAAPLRSELARQASVRPFLDALYRPPTEHRIPRDDVTVCRCEEVSAGQIRRYVELGCLGPNQTKAFGRCGMGPCQGRLCGLTVTEIIAQARGVDPAEVGYYRIRPPVKPITLGELAQ